MSMRPMIASAAYQGWRQDGQISETPVWSRRPWLWAQHIGVTVFMSFMLTYCVGTVLEMHARRSFLKVHHLEDLDWQPGLLPRLMMRTVQQLCSTRSRVLEALGVRGRQQTAVGKKSCESEESLGWATCSSSPRTQGDCSQKSASCRASCCREGSCAADASACAASVPSRTLHVEPGSSQRLAKSCDVGSQSTPAAGVKARVCCATGTAQSASSSSCSARLMAAEEMPFLREVLSAEGMRHRPIGQLDKGACSSSSSACADVSEAQEVCCGVQGEQALACQKLRNQGKALDSKCKQLACRCESFPFKPWPPFLMLCD